MNTRIIVSLFLTIFLFGCNNEIDTKSKIEIYENIEKNTKAHVWYNFRDELPLEKKGKWFKVLTIENKRFVIISGGYKNNGGYNLEISKVKETDAVITITAKLISLNEGTEAFYTPISVVIIDEINFNKKIKVKWAEPFLN